MITVIIPAYNEEKRIREVLQRVPKKYSTIVIDDASKDKTSHVVKSLGHKSVKLKKNSGKGVACIEGVRKSKTNYCIFVDGDGQLNPEEIPKFVKSLKKADIVIGERKANDIPPLRRISNLFARKCINYITDSNFNDVLCGFRAVKKESFKKLKFRKLDYFFECEMLIEAKKKNLKIKAVPVSVKYLGGAGIPLSKSMKIAGWLLKDVIKKGVGAYV